MRMRAATTAAVSLFVLAIAACKPHAQPEPSAPASPKESASPQEHAAAKPKRAPSPSQPEPQPDRRQALRFDMTQQGRMQTAENFDAWMAQQGVRVAKGKPQDAAPAQAGDEAQPSQAPQASKPPQRSAPRRE